jgi:hypothetical protein
MTEPTPDYIVIEVPEGYEDRMILVLREATRWSTTANAIRNAIRSALTRYEDERHGNAKSVQRPDYVERLRAPQFPSSFEPASHVFDREPTERVPAHAQYNESSAFIGPLVSVSLSDMIGRCTQIGCVLDPKMHEHPDPEVATMPGEPWESLPAQTRCGANASYDVEHVFEPTLEPQYTLTCGKLASDGIHVRVE